MSNDQMARFGPRVEVQFSALDRPVRALIPPARWQAYVDPYGILSPNSIVLHFLSDIEAEVSGDGDRPDQETAGRGSQRGPGRRGGRSNRSIRGRIVSRTRSRGRPGSGKRGGPGNRGRGDIGRGRSHRLEESFMDAEDSG